LAIPGEALLQDHDPLELALPFTNEQRAGLQCDALPSLWGATVEGDAGAVLLLGAKVPPDRFVEIAESVGTPSSRDRSSTDSPRSRRNTTSRLRATLQRWPAANGPIVDGFDIVPGKPVDSVDGLSPPSLTTGASATSARSISRLMTLITPVSSRTNSCPEKPGAAHIQFRPRLRRSGEAVQFPEFISGEIAIGIAGREPIGDTKAGPTAKAIFRQTR